MFEFMGFSNPDDIPEQQLFSIAKAFHSELPYRCFRDQEAFRFKERLMERVCHVLFEEQKKILRNRHAQNA